MCYSWCRPRNQLFLLILSSLLLILFYLSSDTLNYSVSVVQSVFIRSPISKGAGIRAGVKSATSTVWPTTISTEPITTQMTESVTTVELLQTTSLAYIDDVLHLSAPPLASDSFGWCGEESNLTDGYNRSSPLPLCLYPPANLVGRLEPNKTVPSNLDELVSRYPGVHSGGSWQPDDCTPHWRVAIVVPFRNRDVHLRVFLNVYHAFLQKQQIAYRIFVVEQSDTTPFNRAMLFNIGFVEALRSVQSDFSLRRLAELSELFMADQLGWQELRNCSQGNETVSYSNATSALLKAAIAELQTFMNTYECFVFHDVDLLPEDDRNIYSCPVRDPRHLSVAIDKFKYELLYPGLFGGASSIRLAQFLKVNGFSNSYFDWGGEDDDFADRVQRFWRIERYPKDVARYTMLTGKEHSSAKQNPRRWQLLKEAKGRFATDGLNSLSGRYELLERRDEPLYTHIRVHIVPPPTLASACSVSGNTLLVFSAVTVYFSLYSLTGNVN